MHNVVFYFKPMISKKTTSSRNDSEFLSTKEAHSKQLFPYNFSVVLPWWLSLWSFISFFHILIKCSQTEFCETLEFREIVLYGLWKNISCTNSFRKCWIKTNLNRLFTIRSPYYAMCIMSPYYAMCMWIFKKDYHLNYFSNLLISEFFSWNI